MLRFLIAGVLAGSALALGVVLDPAEAHHITRCFGERADVNRSHDPSGSFLVGTGGHDVIISSPDTDHVEGRGARDFICGLGGNDELLGGTRADKLNGGYGADELRGGTGNDVLRGGPGRDHGWGGSGTDTCIGIEVRTSCEVVE